MMNKTKIYWICQIGGWTFYALFNLLLFALAGGNVPDFQILVQLLLTGYFIVYSHIYRYLIVKWGWLRILSPRLIPRILLSIILLSISCFFFEMALNVVLGITIRSSDILAMIVSNFFGNMLLYFLWSLVYFVYHYFESYRSTLQYQASINEIQLNKLKSQLNPHFIFNGLNSIRALIDEDPKKAKMAVTQLSNILRNSLGMNEKKLVNFEEEMRTVRDYLDLENVRYEERLQTKLNIHPDSHRFSVPPLMVQTLVENGIKHGISTLIHGGLIQLTTDVEKGKLKIEIKNSGQYQQRTNGKPVGYGIANTVQRLKLLYGEEAKFNIFNLDDSFVITQVVIPEQVII